MLFKSKSGKTQNDTHCAVAMKNVALIDVLLFCINGRSFTPSVLVWRHQAIPMGTTARGIVAYNML